MEIHNATSRKHKAIAPTAIWSCGHLLPEDFQGVLGSIVYHLLETRVAQRLAKGQM